MPLLVSYPHLRRLYGLLLSRTTPAQPYPPLLQASCHRASRTKPSTREIPQRSTPTTRTTTFLLLQASLSILSSHAQRRTPLRALVPPSPAIHPRPIDHHRLLCKTPHAPPESSPPPRQSSSPAQLACHALPLSSPPSSARPVLPRTVLALLPTQEPAHPILKVARPVCLSIHPLLPLPLPLHL